MPNDQALPILLDSPDTLTGTRRRIGEPGDCVRAVKHASGLGAACVDRATLATTAEGEPRRGLDPKEVRRG